MRGRTVGNVQVAEATEQRLIEMVELHRSSFDQGWEPDPFSLWASQTEQYLAEVHELLVEPVARLLDGLLRVELVIESPLLRLLPWETANRPGHAALFERCQINRDGGGSPADPVGRRFRFEFVRGDSTGLTSIESEGILAAAPYTADRRRERPTQRMVHVAGHRPEIPPDLIGAHERAHVVLSGCDSLPDRLGPGVASATASLWPVDDQTNPITMSLFHSRVASGVGPLEALRQTQVFQRSLCPAVWAGYVHLGSPV